VRHAPADIRFIFFSWREALAGRYDVLHVHWPEYFTRGSSKPATAVKRLLFRALLRRLSSRGIPVVRTVHNLTPHATGDEAEARLLRRLDDLTAIDVVLNACTPDRGHESVLIPHGDYREQFASLPAASATPGRLLFIGRIERYKGVLELIQVVQGMARADVELRVVGRPTDDMRSEIDAAMTTGSGNGPRLSAVLEFVSDATMVQEITSSRLVVLPYREMHNSGILLVALSLGRPVLVPAGCVAEELAGEVGKGWVTTYSGELTAEDIRRALAQSDDVIGKLPAFAGRDWVSVASAYGRVYRAAVAGA
jgi:beta-1,4-mannosyltransferase